MCLCCCFLPEDVCLRVTVSALLSFNAYSLFPGLFIINSHSLHLSASIWLFYICYFLQKPSSLNLPLPLNHTPFSFVRFLLLRLFISPLFLSLLFCFGDTGWLCGPEQFWPSRCLWPRSIMAFPFRAWPIAGQGDIDVARQADTPSGRKIKHSVPQKWFDLSLV